MVVEMFRECGWFRCSLGELIAVVVELSVKFGLHGLLGKTEFAEPVYIGK